MTLAAILADDLSGAGSMGAEFACAGFRTLVVRSPALAAGVVGSADVLAVSTDTRNRPGAETEHHIRDAATHLTRLRPRIFIKKLDSLLRGPIATEARATIAATGANSALVVAASPATGRTTIGGRQRVGGRPLHQALPELDPTATIGSDDIVSCFETCGLPVVTLGLTQSRAMPASSHSWSGSITVADCETAEDIARIVHAAYGAGVRMFFGTYGLGAALAGCLDAEPPKPQLIIAGSISEATMLQVEALRANGDCAIFSLADASSETVAATLARGVDVVLHTGPAIFAGPQGEMPPLQLPGGDVEQAVATFVLPLLGLVSGIIVSGGSTADALLVAMRADGLLLADRELGPGIPLMWVRGSEWDGIWFVTKPGSFGDRDALRDARRMLREQAGRR